MTPDSDLSDTYERLLATSRAMTARGLYEVAYHALAAAMHCAEALGDSERLVVVEREAREQLMWIDDRDPEHQLSTVSATKRRNRSVYQSLLTRTHGVRLRVQRRT